MADQNTQFMAILTAVGEAKLANAQALGIPWNITQLGVGDANGAEPTPDRLQTELINEQRLAPLNQLIVSPANASIIVAEQVIPEDVGGWWIREIGLYDEAGDLVAVANCPPTFKPLLAQGSGRTQVVRLNLLVSSTQSITLKIDPSVVLATRAYCDGKVAEELAKLDHKNSVRAATTANIALNGLQTIDGVVLVAGDRVLVKDQAAAKDNGIYLAAAGGWARAADADASIEVTPGMIVPVEQGTANADSVWQLATDGPITLGTTALTFEASGGPSGVTAGTYRSVTVDKRGRVTGGTNPTTLAGYGITDALGADQAAVLAPPGQVAAYAMATPPAGWLKANGALVSRATYAALFAAIGTTYGAGDGVTTFKLPDHRGEFIRGWDDGRGVDAGRVFGSHQLDQMQGHFHGPLQVDTGGTSSVNSITSNITSTGGASKNPMVGNTVAGALSDGTNGTPRTGAETRARNNAQLICIKY